MEDILKLLEATKNIQFTDRDILVHLSSNLDEMIGYGLGLGWSTKRIRMAIGTYHPVPVKKCDEKKLVEWISQFYLDFFTEIEASVWICTMVMDWNYEKSAEALDTTRSTVLRTRCRINNLLGHIDITGRYQPIPPKMTASTH